MRQHEYYDFTPPTEQGSGRALALALLVHGLLIIALTWGVTWHSEKNDPPVQAELWSAVPEPVAPITSPPEPPPPPPPVPEPVKPLKPVEAVKPVKPLPPPASNTREKATADADIAIDKKKKNEEREQDKRKESDKKAAKEKEEAQLKEAKAQKEAVEKKAKLNKEEAKKLDLKKQKEEVAKRAEEQKRKDEQAKQAEEQKRKDEEAKRLAEEQKHKDEEVKRAEEQKRKDEEVKRAEEQKRKDEEAKLEAKRLADEKREREERLKEQNNKFKQLAANSTGPTVSNSSSKDSASSGLYNKKLKDRVKPNIYTFPDSQLQAVKGNPEAEVIVTCSVEGKNGKIKQVELSRSSGNKSWDDTVLKGVEKTGTLPLDENGNCPAKITFVFKLRGD